MKAHIDSHMPRLSYSTCSPRLTPPTYANHRVGEVCNGYHLSGRAIDVAAARVVSHAALELAYRRAVSYQQVAE